MQTTAYQVYCDESGNTGPSLLEPDQPFFVYAFILLPSETVGTLANEVKLLYEEEGISAKDLKASQLWKSSRGLRRYERIGTLLVQTGTSLCLSIIEKRYHSILKFFQVDSTGMLRMTSSARYFKKGVGSSRPN